jgi:hypothetical protein
MKRRIKPISDRQKERLKEYQSTKKKWWKVIEGCWCPVMQTIFGRKVKVQDVHHRRGRVGSLLCDTRYWMAVSRSGHRWIEENMDEARKHGWLANRGDWGR